jgi:cobaltochelatase CobS
MSRGEKMEVKEVKVNEVFPKITGKPGELIVPTGVFDPSNPEDQKLLTLVPTEDPDYLFPGVHVIALLVTIQERDNALIWGSTGVGKSMIAMQLGNKLNLPVTRINFQGEMGSPEIFGYFGLTNPNIEGDDGWKWTALIKGIQRPGIVLLDEWDAIRPEVGIGLQRLLEDHSPGIFLPERDEFIPRHKDCVVMATANTRGLGDATGLYTGTGTQNFAQLNRFHVIIEMEPLAKDKMQTILEKVQFHGAHLKPALVKALVEFYGLALNAHKQDKLAAPISVRTMLHFARYFQLLGHGALELALLSKLASDQEKVAVQQLADRVGLVDPKAKSS